MLLHEATYFAAPLWSPVGLPFDYPTTQLPESTLLQSLQMEEQACNPFANHQILDTKKRSLPKSLSKNEHDEKCTKIFVGDDKEFTIHISDDENELSDKFWMDFCRGDFNSPYDLQEAIKRLGTHRFRSLSFKRMKMLVKSLNESFEAGPILITV